MYYFFVASQVVYPKNLPCFKNVEMQYLIVDRFAFESKKGENFAEI